MPRPRRSVRKSAPTETVWIGLADLRPQPGNDELEGARGAVTNVLARANSAQEFRRAVAEAFDDLAYDLLELEDVETLAARVRREEVPPTLMRIAGRVARTDEVGWDTFYSYDTDDD